MYNKNNENIKIHMFSRNSIYPLLYDGAFSAHINGDHDRSRFNNYKSAHRNFIKGNTVKQTFHTHFKADKRGMSDWEVTLIDQAESVYDLRRRESFWQYELNIFQPNGLHECDVTLF